MNVALVIDSLDCGGAENIVRQLALGLARRGHGACVYCLKHAGPDRDALQAAGVTVREAHSNGRNPLLATRLTCWMWLDRIDVVNAHSSAALVWALPGAKTLGLPIIQTRHGSLLGQPSRYRRWADRLVRFADGVTIVAQSLRAETPTVRVARAARHIPNGVDREPVPRQASRRTLEQLCGRELRGPVVLSIGTICPEKDTLLLLRAFARLREKTADAQLVCIGRVRGRVYGERVRRAKRALRLVSCVHLLDQVHDAYRLMAGADVFCQSSRSETMPIAILEAMSQNVPVVATAVGAIGRVSHGKASKTGLLQHGATALLVPPGDPCCLAAALHCTLADRPGAAARAAQALTLYRQKYTAGRMVARYERMYTHCRCARRGNRRSSARRPAVLMVGPGPREIGGMAGVIDTLMAGPLRRRFQLHRFAVVSGESGRACRPRRLCGLLAAVRHAVHLWELGSVIARERIRLVHVHTCSYFTFYRSLLDLGLARLLGCKVVLHVHGGRFDRFCATAGTVGRWWIRRGCEAAAAVIVLSPRWLALLRPYVGQARLVVAANGVALDDRPSNDARGPAVGEEGVCRFLFLGSQTEEKGLGDLIEATRRLHQAGTRFELDLVGPATSGQRAMWLQRVRAAGLRDVVSFHGPVTGRGKRRLLAAVDCLVHPSHSEGLPLTILEAAAAGLPVIATRVGSVPEALMVGRGGRAVALTPLVPPHDPGALCAAMERMASDPPRRCRVGAALHAHVARHFNSEHQADRIAELYEDVLGGERAEADAEGVRRVAAPQGKPSASVAEGCPFGAPLCAPVALVSEESDERL